MPNWYTNFILTLITLLLAAITAKLYLPAAQLVGPQLSAPTRGDILAASKLNVPQLRQARLEELKSRAPAVWVNGGNIQVYGTVDVDNTVEVEGKVSIGR